MVTTMRSPLTREQLEQTIAALITNGGTSAERLIDAYEGISAALCQPGVLTGRMVQRAQRLQRDLDEYASQQRMRTIVAIAHMDEPMLRYWATRVLGLADALKRPADYPESGERPRISDE